MKLLHVINCLSTGGAERALCNLLQGGLAKNFECHVISMRDKGTIGPLIMDLGVPVTTLGMRGGVPPISSFSKLRRVVRQFSPNIIQGWMYQGNLVATLARRFSINNPSLICGVRHSLYDLRHEKFIARQILRANRYFSTSPDSILYNSHVSLKQHEAFGFSSGSSQVISNGIDVDKFNFAQATRDRVRTELGIPADAKVIGHVGRLHPMKNHPLFLSAATDVACSDTNVHIILSGRGVSIESKILSEQIPSQTRGRVHLLGDRSDVPMLMCAVDVLVSSSSYGEGFPNVIGEAMATGVPSVATDVGDSAVIIGGEGVVTSSQDKNAIVAGIEKILKVSVEKRNVMRKKTRLRIVSNYTLDTAVQNYTTLYKNLYRNNDIEYSDD